VLPLSDDAMAALRDLVRLKACGPFTGRGVLRAWQIACKKVVGRTFRIKDLRHSFVTGIVRATQNLETAQLLAGHTDARTTRRYAMAALLPMLRAGVDAAFPPEPKKEKEPTP
jgi:integrase